jgi:hypothetical protein
MIGAGLAAAAIIGVVIIRADDTAVAPIQTRPEVAPQPTATSTPDPTTTVSPASTAVADTGASVVVDGGCLTVTATATGSATGCPSGNASLDHLEQRTFVADLDGPVLITSGSADPLADLNVTVDTGNFATNCQWGDLAPRIPAGGIIELVVCNDAGVMGATTGREATQDEAMSYFTLPTPYLPDGTDLGPGTPVDGLPRSLAFAAPVQDSGSCSILLLPDRTGWKEACQGLEPLDQGTALVQLDPRASTSEIALPSTMWQISIDETGRITSATALDTMAPSSGCSLNSAAQLLQAVPPSSIVGAIGCIDDKAALTTASVLTQDGPPDGSIWTALRDQNGVWSINDYGTGIESGLTFPVVPVAVWEAWPQSTITSFRSYWWEPIVAVPTQPTIDAFADELLATLRPLNPDPEFPLNERIVEVQPAGLPLIVAQVDLGGDDSVVGAVLYVWLEQAFDDQGPSGWRAGHVLVGDVCGRGDSSGELCV